jgi:hypothetical protein
MRKFAIFLVTALVLSLTAVAYAAQTNEYSISGSTSPKTSGSKSKPRPIGIKFGFDVKEATGQRPAVVQKYTITFGGTRVNKSVADTCSKSALEDQGTAGCKAKSIVGTGFIENQTGSTADANDKSIECNAALSVVNHSGSSASIYVKGDPNSTNPKTRCAIELAAPIPATFKNTSKGSQLTFTVPQSLRHPGAPTISNAVVSVESTIKRITKGGKGFYEARGGCTRGKRTVSVKFTTEAGQSSTESKKVACS